MSKPMICTVEELEEYLKNTVSERRYIHSVGVAQTTKMLLEKYGCKANPEQWDGFCAPIFCGLAHDLSLIHI